jgi:hypothetical protein
VVSGEMIRCHLRGVGLSRGAWVGKATMPSGASSVLTTVEIAYWTADSSAAARRRVLRTRGSPQDFASACPQYVQFSTDAIIDRQRLRNPFAAEPSSTHS